MQDKLQAEAYRRTQGPEEPVLDFVECVLAIVEKFDDPWPEYKIVDLLHRNMSPRLRTYAISLTRQKIFWKLSVCMCHPCSQSIL